MGIRLKLAGLAARATHSDLVVGRSLPAADLVPTNLPPRVAVLVAGAAGPGWLAFTCPCGDGHQVMINLAASRRPRWQLTGSRRAPTIHPSVDLADGDRRCHFWVRHGRVQWAEPPRTAAPRFLMEET
jgi:Family of unknown function (DUF6527)